MRRSDLPLAHPEDIALPQCVEHGPGILRILCGHYDAWEKGRKQGEMQSSEILSWFAVVKLPFAATPALGGNGRDTRYGGCWPKRIFVAAAQAGTGS